MTPSHLGSCRKEVLGGITPKRRHSQLKFLRGPSGPPGPGALASAIPLSRWACMRCTAVTASVVGKERKALCSCTPTGDMPCDERRRRNKYGRWKYCVVAAAQRVDYSDAHIGPAKRQMLLWWCSAAAVHGLSTFSSTLCSQIHLLYAAAPAVFRHRKECRMEIAAAPTFLISRFM